MQPGKEKGSAGEKHSFADKCVPKLLRRAINLGTRMKAAKWPWAMGALSVYEHWG
jgi:hypothetical protein